MNFELIVQLGSLALITIAGPLIVALLFLRQGNL
nr:photosystem II reaction center protein Ycf12/Psb30 [Euglena undulata]WCH63411.1 photosystem II reaction center protein Ycf12/Psb30 [Euglena undulata]